MTGSGDPYDLSRFQGPQEDDYEQALAEIVSGRKGSHWMWYINALDLAAPEAQLALHNWHQ